ncbi:MAG: exopolyphosphatase [Alphaproteobacteria bacterium]|nr:exopolyphosphatase [Alphaproteobacteria bacterium]MBO4644349.1 exopolyphosphatase [Alphaproteobacteria bacterium]
MLAKKRLLTRSDFDGLVCAALLKELGIIDEIQFVHPKDMQDGRISITDMDITANLPYVEGVDIAFDHHISELARVNSPPNHIVYPNAPSAARVVYEYYGAEKRFTNLPPSLMEAVDVADSAKYTEDQILNPTGWVLLTFIMDPRTGLGRFKNFRINNYSLMMKLVDLCRTQSIDEILKDEDVQERVQLYMEHKEKFVDQLKKCTQIHKNAAHLNLRNEEIIYAGNRFVIYALFPQINISVHEMWGKNKRNVVFAVGKSIFNRTSKMNIGEFLLQYGGGGHATAGTCQVHIDEADKVRQEIITAMIQDV